MKVYTCGDAPKVCAVPVHPPIKEGTRDCNDRSENT